MEHEQRFDILGRLGAGRRGVVYHALDRRSHRRVALKTLDLPERDAHRALRREFEALRDVRHPNVVTPISLGRHLGRPALAMELVEGLDLLSWLAAPDAKVGALIRTMGPAIDTEPTADLPAVPRSTPPPLTPDPAPRFRSAQPHRQRPGARPCGPKSPRRFAGGIGRLRDAFAQLFAGVAALHRAGWLHRDIKSGNLRVTAGGRLVILDLELALATTTVAASGSAEVCGTPMYMAPELLDRGTASALSDLYAVGVLLYAALTGRWPFAATGLDALRASKRTLPTPPAAIDPRVPSDLDALCMSLLAPSPLDRRPAVPSAARLVAPAPPRRCSA